MIANRGWIRKRTRSSLAGAACCAAAALLAAQSAQATDYTWTGSTTGNFNDPTKWLPNTAFPVAGDTATFNTTGVNANETIAMNGAQAAASLTFANTGSTTITHSAGQTLTLTNGFTVNSGAGAVVLGTSSSNAFINLGGSSQTFTNNNGSTAVTINGAITNAGNANPVTLTLDGSGTGGLQNLGTTTVPNISEGGGGQISIVKNGTGTWQLNNNASASSNNFTGDVTINLGVLKINGSNALGVSPKTLHLTGSSATLAAVNSTRTIPAVISTVINGNITFGVSGGASLGLAGTVDLTGGNRSITCNAGTTTLSGAVSNGSITKKGSSTLQFGSTANTFSGLTMLTGNVAVSGSNDLPSNLPILLETNSTLNLNSAGAMTIGSLSDGGTTPGGLTIGNLGTTLLTTGTDNTNTSFSGVIFGNGNQGAIGGITKTGSGTFTLGTGNTYNAVTTISGGTLVAKTLSNGGLTPSISTTNGSNLATVGDATGLQVGMFVGSMNNLGLGVTVALDTITGITGTSISLSAGAIANSSGVPSIIGFANSLGTAMNTAQFLVLDGGTLRYIGPDVTTDRLFTITQNGGTIDASGSGVLVFAGNGANQIAFTGSGARTLTLTGSNTAANTLAPVLNDGVGATSLTKSGSGTWVIATTLNTYSGNTTISGGTLVVQGSGSLGAESNNIVFANGGSLEAQGAVLTARNVLVNAGGGFFDTAGNDSTVGNVDGAGDFTKVNAGQLTVNYVRAGNLNVAGGTLAVAANSTATGVSHVADLTIAPGARLNLSDNKLITSHPAGTWNGSAYTDIAGYVASGRGTGNLWDGSSGIITNQSAAVGSNFTSVGVARASDVLPATATATALWGGQTITGTDTLVMYTYGGDATLDGKINVDDYIRIDSGIAAGLTGWSNGDFNYDGKINIDDYTQFIDANIGTQGAPFSTSSGGSALTGQVSAVPEPATLGLLGAAILSLPLHRSRRRHRRA